MNKISYMELRDKMFEFNRQNNIRTKGAGQKILKGVIVFTEDSFNKIYPLESRSYLVTNDNKGFIKEQVKEESRAIVKDVLEKHVYKNTSDLEKLCTAADNIINDITSEDEVMERVANIRKEGTDIYSHSINVCAMATLIALKNNFEKTIDRSQKMWYTL